MQLECHFARVFAFLIIILASIQQCQARLYYSNCLYTGNYASNPGLNTAQNNILYPGDCLYSSSYANTLCYASDGNLLATRSNVGAYWTASYYNIRSAGYAIMQSDGNFVLYNANGAAYFATSTSGSNNKLMIQSSGNVVVYDGSGNVLYQSNTAFYSADSNACIAAPTFPPTPQPTPYPTANPTPKPTPVPTPRPTPRPSSRPTGQPTQRPSIQPSDQPTRQPARAPTSCPSRQPTSQPTLQPSIQPTYQPSSQPINQPTTQPTKVPTRQPSTQPFCQPSTQPSTSPSIQPSTRPTLQPSSQPSPQPSSQPSLQPASSPSSQPSRQPTRQPSRQPTTRPSSHPSDQPMACPTARPSRVPSRVPSIQPSIQPSTIPTIQPTHEPSGRPTLTPSDRPSMQPLNKPTTQPTKQPLNKPTAQPLSRPSRQPSRQPSDQPSSQPTCTPTRQPTQQPSFQPILQPTAQPTDQPLQKPTSQPTQQPSSQPSRKPSRRPTSTPSRKPTELPTRQPSEQPTDRPSQQPSREPTSQPTGQPSQQPQEVPSRQPSASPSSQPTRQPSTKPSRQPTQQPSSQPTGDPSNQPSSQPTKQPLSRPSSQPSVQPTAIPSDMPTAQPSEQPTSQPTSRPSAQPTRQPYAQPTRQPLQIPTRQPSSQPSKQPIVHPTGQPSEQPTRQPSNQPSHCPSNRPTLQPTSQPSSQPSTLPSADPTSRPSGLPSMKPSIQPTRQPLHQPSKQPVSPPSGRPSATPTIQPTHQPLSRPTGQPTSQPNQQPTNQPTCQPYQRPTTQPTKQPFRKPTSQPSRSPSQRPTIQPTRTPSSLPSKRPSAQPLSQPSACPSTKPTMKPSMQPSNQPSMRPSEQPTSQPSSCPSRIPTMRPSLQPSGNPSLQPTAQPSSDPTGQPSVSPSRPPTSQPSSDPTQQPSHQPSRQPSSQPLTRPTNQPTRQPRPSPTGQPSRQPSKQPITQPSRVPTTQPTNYPSALPSTHPSQGPSLHPSSQPSLQPLSSPSRQPTKSPSRQPTVKPRAHPTFHPSSQPSQQPVNRPSRKPTAQPSLQPSRSPSHRPSHRPSSQPSDQPTMRPSNVPSSQPSNQPKHTPTSQPTTHPLTQPTQAPTTTPTNKPSLQPTHQPISQPSSQPASKPSKRPSPQPSRQPTVHPLSGPTTSPSTQPTEYPTRMPSGQPSPSPSHQPSTHPSRLPTTQPTDQPSQQPIERPTRSPSSRPSSQPSDKPQIKPTGGPSRQPITEPSSTPTLQPTQQPIEQPSRLPTLQPVNVPSHEPSTQPLSSPSATPSLTPSAPPTAEPLATPTSIPFAYPTPQPYSSPSSQPSQLPYSLPSMIPISHPTRYPTCAPSSTPTSVPSTVPIVQPSQSPSVQPSSWPTTVRPTSSPSRFPSAFPSAEPSQQPIHAPSVQPSASPSQQPSCSPSSQSWNRGTVVVDAFTKSVNVGESVLAMLSVMSTVLPNQALYLSVFLTNSYRQKLMQFSPSNVSFTLTSTATQQNLDFIQLNTPGRYYINATLWGPAAKHFALSIGLPGFIDVLGSSTKPIAPEFTRAQFSNDGATIFLTFDTTIDARWNAEYGMSNFDCSLAFEMPRGESARCQWANDGVSVTVFLSPTSSVVPGDSVILLSNTLKGSCLALTSNCTVVQTSNTNGLLLHNLHGSCESGSSSCETWTYAVRASQRILAAAIPIMPIVSVQATSVISTCTDITVDLLLSTGSCGRSWMNFTFTVTLSSTSTNDALAALSARSIELYLNMQSTVASPIVVPSSLFGSHAIEFKMMISVRLCNFLGTCGSGDAMVSVVNAQLPSVTIAGSSRITMTRVRVLSLSSVAFTPTCDGSASSSTSPVTMDYSWSVFQGDQSGIRVTVNSASTDPTALVLSAYTLQASTTYTVTLVVTNTFSRLSATASKVVVVAAGVLVPIVRGGSLQTVQLGSPFSLDGSSSYDSDQPSRGRVGMLFSWSCVQRSPVYSTRCNIFNSSSPTAMSSSSCSGAAAVDAANSSYSVSLTVYDSTRSATIVTTLVIVGAGAPTVAIQSKYSAVSAAINPASSVQLVGTVSMPGPGVLTWSVDDPSISLQSVALTPIQQTVSAATPAVAVNLVVSPNSLPQRTTLTFTLTAKLQDSTISSTPSSSSSSLLQSFASVSLAMNGAPLPGLLTVSPLTGLALSTDFKFAAPSWVDSDIPLSYQFSLLTGGGVLLVLQSQSQAAGGLSMLPAGSISLVAQIYDVFEAKAVAKLSVNVTANVQQNFTTMYNIDESLRTATVQEQKQIISLVALSISSINCSLISSAQCASLNRHSCSATSNTCGPCVDYTKYVGASGDSNTVCVPVSGAASALISKVGRSCGADYECGAWEACNQVTHVCEVIGKQCPSACSGHGSCSFVSSLTGLAVDSCTVINSGCSAVCSCSQGYYGSSCSLTSVQLVSLEAVRSQLLVSLQTVVGSEFPSQAAVESWAAALAAITTDPLQLTPPAQAAVVSTAKSILARATAVELPVSSVHSLYGTINSVASASQPTSEGTVWSGRKDQRRLSANLLTDAVVNTLDQLSSLELGQMLAGQNPVDIIQGNFRMSSQVVLATTSRYRSSSGTTILTIPRSSLESFLAQAQSSVAVPVAVAEAAANVTLSALNSNSFAHFTLNASQFCAANALRLQFSSSVPINKTTPPRTHSQPPSSLPAETAKLVFTFLRDRALPYIHNSTVSSSIFTTRCRVGLVEAYTYFCPLAANITVQCDGREERALHSRCPEVYMTTSCLVVFSISAGGSSADGGSGGATVLSDYVCSIVNSSKTTITCGCSVGSNLYSQLAAVVLLHSNNSTSGISSTSSTTSSSSGSTSIIVTLEVVPAVTYSAVTVPAVLLPPVITDTIIHAPTPPLFVLVTFILVWGLSFAVSFSMGPEINWYNIVRPIAFMKAQHAKPRVGIARASEAAKILTAEATRNFVPVVFPLLYADSPIIMQIFTHLRRSHCYWIAAMMPGGYHKIVTLVVLLTNITLSMLLIAVFYDMQWPSIDEHCSHLQSDSTCTAVRSPFDAAAQLCTWTASDPLESQAAVCRPLPQTFNPYVLIFISALVMALAGPAHTASLELINFLRHHSHSLETAACDGKQISTPETAAKLDSALDMTMLKLGSVCFPHDSGSAKLLLSLIDRHLGRRLGLTDGGTDAARNSPHDSPAPQPLHSYLADPSHYSSVDALKRQLSEVYASIEARDRYAAQWSLLFEGPQAYFNWFLCRREWGDPVQDLADEMIAVNIEAEQTAREHANASTETIRLSILDIFVADLIGRKSLTSKLLKNHARMNPGLIENDKDNARHPHRYRVPWLGHVLAVSGLAFLNVTFICLTLSYCQDKGVAWRTVWVVSCAIHILLEICVSEVSVLVFMRLLVPHWVMSDALAARRTIEGCLLSLQCGRDADVFSCEFSTRRSQGPTQGRSQTTVDVMATAGNEWRNHNRDKDIDSEFSATDFLFVSAKFARAFPDLPESRLVLSYRTPFVSSHQSRQWTQRYTNVRVNTASALIAVIYHQLMQVVESFLWIGCLPYKLQVLLLRSVVSPIVAAAAACLGTAMLHGLLAGIPLGVLVVGIIVLTVCLGRRYTLLATGTTEGGRHHLNFWPPLRNHAAGRKSGKIRPAQAVHDNHEISYRDDSEDQSFPAERAERAERVGRADSFQTDGQDQLVLGLLQYWGSGVEEAEVSAAVSDATGDNISAMVRSREDDKSSKSLGAKLVDDLAVVDFFAVNFSSDPVVADTILRNRSQRMAQHSLAPVLPRQPATFSQSPSTRTSFQWPDSSHANADFDDDDQSDSIGLGQMPRSLSNSDDSNSLLSNSLWGSEGRVEGEGEKELPDLLHHVESRDSLSMHSAKEREYGLAIDRSYVSESQPASVQASAPFDDQIDQCSTALARADAKQARNARNARNALSVYGQRGEGGGDEFAPSHAIAEASNSSHGDGGAGRNELSDNIAEEHVQNSHPYEDVEESPRSVRGGSDGIISVSPSRVWDGDYLRDQALDTHPPPTLVGPTAVVRTSADFMRVIRGDLSAASSSSRGSDEGSFHYECSESDDCESL